MFGVVFWSVVGSFLSRFSTFGGCTILELLWPAERQSILRSRARGTLFWLPYFAIGVAAQKAIAYAMMLSGFRPLFNVDLRWTAASENWLAIAVGYIVAPLGALIIGDLFYYWMHRAQHAVPLLWRFHSLHHSITELNATNSYHHATEEILK